MNAALGKILPLRFGFMNLVLTVLYAFFLVLFQFRGNIAGLGLNLHDLGTVAAGVVSVNLLWQFLGALTGRIRILRFLLAVLLLFLYILLGTYHYRSTSFFDLSLMLDNAGESFTRETADVIMANIGWSVVVFLSILVGGSVWLEGEFRLFSRCSQSAPLWPKALVAGLLYGGVLASPLPMPDELTHAAQTLVYYYTADMHAEELYTPGTFPLVRERPAAQSPETLERPHIFVVFVESFNPRFVESRSPEGVVYMPFFSRMISQGLYAERYYGNSIQTCKGQFALFFSLIPSIQGKEYPRYAANHFLSLPKILGDNGYRTIFFQCYKNLAYDNVGGFLGRQGFQITRSTAEFTTADDAPYIWGFGLQDDRFYRKFFSYLDALRASGDHSGPFFAALQTTSNHMYFNKVPRDRRELYPDPANTEQAYANSIRLSDRGLEVFFEELAKRPYLANSLVIVTGDHGYPLGEHGYYNNEVGFYDEFFRTPFLIVWPGHLAPRRLAGGAWSHMDVAPTLLDLLRLPVRRHHFQGTSMAGGDAVPHPVFLVQPYKGRYLGVVRWPFKYVWSQRTGSEYFFNLAVDPGEKENRSAKMTSVEHAEFKVLLQTILLNQSLLDRDAVWSP